MSSFDPYSRPEDEFNPYASPKASLGGPGWEYETGPASTLPFGVGEVFGRSWEIFKANWGLCIGTVIACFVLNFLSGQLPNLIASLVAGLGGAAIAPPGQGMPVGPGAVPMPIVVPGNPVPAQVMMMYGIVAVILTFASVIFQVWIGIGQALVMLNLARGRETSFNDVFRGGPLIVKVILASLLFGFMIWGVVLIGALPGLVAYASGAVPDQATLTTIFVLGVAVAMIVMILVAIRFSQFYYLIVERGAGPLEALRLSMEVTRGRVLGIFFLGVLTFLVNLGGLLACGIGLIVTGPFSVLMLAVTYLSLVGGPVADPAGRGKPYVAGDPLFEG